MMEGLHAPFSDKDVDAVMNLELNQTPKSVSIKKTFEITDTTFQDEDEKDNLPLSWKIKRKMVPTSKKGERKGDW